MLPIINGEFRLVADPELIFGKQGTPICKFRLVANSRKQVDGEWQDDKTVWLRAVAFNRLGTHVAGTFKQGDLALVTGRLHTDEWERDDGTKGQAYEITVDTIGPSLAFVEATMNKVAPPKAESTDPWETPTEAPF